MKADEINLSDLEFWLLPDGERDEAFAVLRREMPVSYHPAPAYSDLAPPGAGYWALTRYEDVWHASRHPELFSSGQGVNIADMPVEISEFFNSIIAMDDPRHAKLRALVSRGFTPRTVAKLMASVKDKAREIVDEVAPKGECDFVHDIAAKLPLAIICDMMGIPPDDHDRIFERTNTILGVGDPEYVTSLEDLLAAGGELFEYAMALGEKRLADPTDDVTSRLMMADVEGERLTTQEFGSFFILLVVAGNETTRTAISHGMKALTDHPDQRKDWLSDFDAVTPTAVEEIVRWATPVIHFRRTVAQETVIGGQTVVEGDKVILWYNSANRDESKFADPMSFDVRRSPNDHVGFGAGGPHFCLGAHLARREIAVMFDELLHRLPDIEVTGEPDRLLSSFIHGIKRMPCAFTPLRS
jgi:methyl-branched lipid omega-hydroxylase